MYLRRLILSQFRTWAYREFSLSPSLAYIQGPNGSGKTSVLEAIHYLSTGRSFRTHRDADCIHWGGTTFSIRGELEDGPVESLALRYRSNSGTSGKAAKVDGELLERLSELQGRVPTVLFAPDDLQILKGEPQLRRRYLNQFSSTLWPRYTQVLQRYERALRQRNELLKGSSPDPDLLESYEERMVESGSVLIEDRREALSRLEPLLREEVQVLTGSFGSGLELRYDPDLPMEEDPQETFRRERPRALQRGYTTIGPQRDDWMVYRDGRPMDRFGSQGELRIVLISLKFSEASVILSERNTNPLVLLDDLESELDMEKRVRCVERILDCPYQVIFTGTNPPPEDTPLCSDQTLTLQPE